jgi:hypothetical protein
MVVVPGWPGNAGVAGPLSAGRRRWRDAPSQLGGHGEGTVCPVVSQMFMVHLLPVPAALK